MTDEQAFLELMNRFGIRTKRMDDDKAIYQIKAKDQDGLPVQGYYNFYTHWTFDPQGKFICLGIWE